MYDQMTEAMMLNVAKDLMSTGLMFVIATLIICYIFEPKKLKKYLTIGVMTMIGYGACVFTIAEKLYKL